MSADELLRRYLEQRRELGERELVLDDMSVEEVMRIIGAKSGGQRGGASLPRAAQEPPRAERPASPDQRRHEPAITAGDAGDWRAQLTASGNSAPNAGGDPRPAKRETPPDRGAAPPSGLVVGGGEAELFGGPIAQVTTLDEIAAMVASCTRCPLYKTATHPVPGEGSPKAELMCVGEAPGATEDETGRPFVGAAGQLLTKILAAINLKREDVFIANVLKHRPPGNRNPLPDEVTACRPYLVRQIELIRPKVIIAFGTFAAQSLLDTKLALGKLRGAVHHYHGIPVVVTYHPAALLRNPAWKRPTWEDVQLARRILDNASA